jgi:hypothetical protein
MNTGEDTQGLRKIIDFTRLLSLMILAIHFYITCYKAFYEWHWTAEITDKLVVNIAKTGLFKGIWLAKLAALVLLIISLIGAKGRKDEHIQKNSIAAYLLCGILAYLISPLMFYLHGRNSIIAAGYIGLSVTGYLLILAGGTRLSRLIKKGLNKDVFNTENETFPQEERLLENEYSVNLPAKYHHLKDHQ